MIYDKVTATEVHSAWPSRGGEAQWIPAEAGEKTGAPREALVYRTHNPSLQAMYSSVALKRGVPCTFGPPLPESGGHDPTTLTGSPPLQLSARLCRTFLTKMFYYKRDDLLAGR